MKKCILLMSWLVFVGNLLANNSNYCFWRLNINQGLSHSNVTSILSDSRGLLWIGTAFGLNCYDRQAMKCYFHRNEDSTSLPGNYINFVIEDAQNNIWVSSSGGLVRYDRRQDAFVPAIADRKVYPKSYCHTAKGVLFGDDTQLYLYNYEKSVLEELPMKEKSQNFVGILSMGHWTDNCFLIVTQNLGVWEYNLEDGILRKSVFPLLSGITAAYVDAKQNLYVAAYRKGVFIFNKDGGQIHQLTTANSFLTDDTVIDMEERDGQLWMATDGAGIFLLDMEKPFSLASLSHNPEDVNSLPTNSIYCLYKDSRQNMWAGSMREGVFNMKEAFIKTYKNVSWGNSYGLSNQSVACLCKDRQGFIWIGTDGGGVNRYDPSSGTFIHFRSTYNGKVAAVVDYSPSELLISIYDKGVFLFNKQTGACAPFLIVDKPTNDKLCLSSSILMIYKMSDDRFLFTSQDSYIYDKRTDRFSILTTKEPPAQVSFLRLIDVVGDTAYFFHGNDLLKVDLKSNCLFKLFRIGDEEVLRVARRDANGLFWIGTDRGLRCFNPVTKRYEKIQTSLFDCVSCLFIENDRRVWLGTQSALFSYDIKDGTFLPWEESDGYLPNELSEICQDSGESPYFYLGGTHGLVQVDKAIRSGNDEHPELKLVDVILDGVSLWDQMDEIEKNLLISWDYKLLQIKVASLEKDIFRKKLFRYTIIEHNIQDKKVKTIETYSPIFSLDQILPGEYSIQVSCYTDTGEWSLPVQILHLNVAGPWYKDYRVILGAVVLLLGLLCWRVVVIIRRKEEKMKWSMSEMVQKANQEKIQFLINISHELRTPLTLIYAPLKKMMEKVEGNRISKEEQEYLKRQLTSVHKSANQMKNIINMTLDVNRIDDTQNALDKKPHALNEWIYSIVADFEYEFEAKQIRPAYQLDETIGLVEFDDIKCEAVISNLLMNALKFSPEGSVITISSSLTEQAVRVSVADQGIGLGDLDPNKLFSRFYQGEHHQQGSGIGLSYAKTLVKKQGGTIGAFNNLERGATFYFELPFSLSFLLLPESPVTDAALPPPLFFLTNAYSIVVAEDNDELRSFIVESLQDDFRTVYPAADGEEAWQIMTEKQADILVSDIMMPRMDGYELCRKVKTDEHTRHIPVVLLTARGDKDSTAAGYNQGADAYLSKPFDLDFLLAILRNQLRNREIAKQIQLEAPFPLVDDMPLQPTTVQSEEEFMPKLRKIVLDNLSSRELGIKFLTEQLGISRTPLYAKLKAYTQMGVNDYINQLRIEKSLELLLHPQLTIAEVSEMVGFEYQRYFSTLFKQMKGLTPRQYRQRYLEELAQKNSQGNRKDD